jgi:hypothetical protein
MPKNGGVFLEWRPRAARKFLEMAAEDNKETPDFMKWRWLFRAVPHQESETRSAAVVFEKSIFCHGRTHSDHSSLCSVRARSTPAINSGLRGVCSW